MDVVEHLLWQVLYYYTLEQSISESLWFLIPFYFFNLNDVRVKRSKSDCACTKRIETLGPAKHEQVALLRGMRVFLGLRELRSNEAIRDISMRLEKDV